jgi:hypothetical protein
VVNANTPFSKRRAFASLARSIETSGKAGFSNNNVGATAT